MIYRRWISDRHSIGGRGVHLPSDENGSDSHGYRRSMGYLVGLIGGRVSKEQLNPVCKADLVEYVFW